MIDTDSYEIEYIKSLAGMKKIHIETFSLYAKYKKYSVCARMLGISSVTVKCRLIHISKAIDREKSGFNMTCRSYSALMRSGIRTKEIAIEKIESGEFDKDSYLVGDVIFNEVCNWAYSV